MLSYGKDYVYANQRLPGTVVLLEGEPIHVLEVSPTGIVRYRSCLDAVEDLTARLEDVSLQPLRLGYINYPTTVDYLKRMPQRVQKQGLGERTIRSSIRCRLSGPAFINCVLGNYPSLGSVLDALVNEEATGQAFARNFAVTRKRGAATYRLLYKQREVGGVNLNNGQPVLGKPFAFLTEALERSMTRA